MRSRRVEYGSFRARMEDLVPLLGADPQQVKPGFDKAPKPFARTRRRTAYLINQYLFEHSRR